MASLRSVTCPSCGRPLEEPQLQTKRQREIVAYIARHYESEGVYPTLREIAREMRLSTKTVHGHITNLIQIGVLVKRPHVARGICFVEGSQR